MGWLALGAGLLTTGLPLSPVYAAKSNGMNAAQESKQIAGWLERITLLPENRITLAKLDTGAKTSSIHAEDIEHFEREGEAWVRYTLVLKEAQNEIHRLPRESRVVRKVHIKDHKKRPDARPVVELEFCMDGRSHSARFSLVDRGTFLYSVLLGRDFLAGSFVVDPDVSFSIGASCASERAPEKKAP
jgi:hypothetical protein